ncbi:MAG TPA: TrmO family methyltransferase [Bacteroidia bacterium]|nr:TrmO family methyltransferase [Bacteroidia bacterium]
MDIILHPVAHVVNSRLTPEDDYWGSVISEIKLNDELSPDAFLGIESYSHLEIIFYFNALPEGKIEFGARYPRDNQAWPLCGIFAQRAAGRPGKIGATIVQFLEKKGRSIFVKGLDAIHGTPVLDIKPVFREFLPREEIHQPQWTHELMKNYWQ